MIQSEVEEILKTAKHVPDAIQLEVSLSFALLRRRNAKLTFAFPLFRSTPSFSRPSTSSGCSPKVSWLLRESWFLLAFVESTCDEELTFDSSLFSSSQLLSLRFVLVSPPSLHLRCLLFEPFISTGNLNPTYAGKISTEGRIVDHPVVVELAKKYGKTASQVVLSWGIGHDLAVIPKSSNPTRIKVRLKSTARAVRETSS